MPKEKVSRYAAKLRELGFEPFTPEQEAYVEYRVERRLIQLMGRPLTHKERRAAKKAQQERTFIIFSDENGDRAHVRDELGHSWRTEKEIDPAVLKALGFKDETLGAYVAAMTLPILPSEKLN